MLQTLRGLPQAVKIRKNPKYNCSISYWTPEVINTCSVCRQNNVMSKIKKNKRLCRDGIQNRKCFQDSMINRNVLKLIFLIEKLLAPST